MKKISIIMMILLVLTIVASTCIAETFTLHSGVTFGMSMEEVREKEKNFDVSTDSFKNYYTHNCSSVHSNTGLTVTGQIAGVSGADIQYHFKNGKLDSAVYGLGWGNSPHDAYSPIRESLIKKYGAPDTASGKLWRATLPMCVYSFADFLVATLNGTEKDFSDDSWLIQQDDGSYVLITGSDYCIRLSDRNMYMTFVGYQHFDEASINKVLSDYKDFADTYQNQLDNDL